jgi:hypothetical protein
MIVQPIYLKKLIIDDSELIINSSFNAKKNFPFSQIKKVYVSVGKASVSTKRYFLFISFITAAIVMMVFPSAANAGIIVSLITGGYLFLHFYKFCTLNLELIEEKFLVRFISYDIKYELVNFIRELRINIEVTKSFSSLYADTRQILLSDKDSAVGFSTGIKTLASLFIISY